MSFWTNRTTLTGLQLLALGRAFIRYRNPRRRKFGGQLDAFNERAWREAAESIGATFESLGSSVFEIGVGDVRTRVVENVSGIDDPVTLTVLHNKPLTHKILQGVGLPVPRHASFSLKNMSPAVAFIETAGHDCVVKPASGTGGGRGVTTGVRTRSHLARAAAWAAVYGDDLMVEEQITGDNYRLLYLDGELIDAYVRKLPAVTGDGATSIKRLIELHNEERMKGGMSQVLLSIDMDCRRTLARQGYSLRSVPANGVNVTVKTVVNENTGVDNSTVTEILCDSIVEDGARVPGALRARFIGIDMLIPDPTQPLADTGGVILEVNGTPNLYYHYNKRDGVFPAAIPLLKRLLPVADKKRSSPEPRSATLVH